MKADIQSDAFQRATLRSERYRIIGLLILICVLLPLPAIRGFVNPRFGEWSRVLLYISFWICCAAYEAVILWMVIRAQRADRCVASWVWVLNTIVESALPTTALIGLSADKLYLGPYRSLVGPTVLAYGFFIVLSTLRLSPALSILAGAVSGGGYLGAYLLTLYVAPASPNREFLPAEIFLVYPIMIFATGIVAAAVAWQIRRHVIATLNEAETKRKLDRIEYDLKVARSIQMGLLPKKPPRIAGYDIAGFSEPADQTGGDYYDWIELPDGRIIFTIADATGHGIGPALLVAACRAYFRAMATRDDPLERITEQVDELIAADVTDGRFITAAIALLEPDKHRLSLYSAGHAPIYFYEAASQALAVYDADQPPLGVNFGKHDSAARTIPLSPGDALVLVTDGFFECSNRNGDRLGTERLGQGIRQYHDSSAQTLINRLREEVVAFSNGVPQADDLTAVVIKRRQ